MTANPTFLKNAYIGTSQYEGYVTVRMRGGLALPCLAACGHSFAELAPFIEGRVIDGQPIRVLSLEGLLLTKEGMRNKDRADATVLRAALEKLRKGSG